MFCLGSGPDRYYPPFVILVIAFPHITSQLFVLLPWFQYTFTANALLIFIFFNFGCFMIYWNYYLACQTSPGHPVSDWTLQYIEITTPDTSLLPIKTETSHSKAPVKRNGFLSSHVASIEMQNYQVGSQKPEEKQHWRYCQKCQILKPPRAHHCSTCKRCVLRMDHHCPWINNCVGYFNIGHFYRFLIYVNMTVFSLLVLLGACLIDVLHTRGYVDPQRGFVYDLPVPIYSIFFICLNFFILLLVQISVGILSIYQTIYVCTNSTTIEGFEWQKVERCIKHQKLKPIIYPYQLSIYENIKQVLGDRWYLWLWPQKMTGSGTRFPVTKKYEPQTRRHTETSAEMLNLEEHLYYYYPPPVYYEEKLHQGLEDDYDDDSDTEELIKLRPNARIRRGSEGYEIRTITQEERERMVQEQVERYANYQKDL